MQRNIMPTKKVIFKGAKLQEQKKKWKINGKLYPFNNVNKPFYVDNIIITLHFWFFTILHHGYTKLYNPAETIILKDSKKKYKKKL